MNLSISIFRSPTNGLLYVSDNLNHRVQIFNDDGTYNAQFGSFGSGDRQFMDHYGITMDTVNNKIFVSDMGNSDNPRIQIFNDDGTYSSQFGSFSTGPGQFYSPMSLTFENSQLYVTDYSLNNIQTFDENGNFLGKFDVSSIPPVLLSRPRDIAVNSNHVYILDYDNVLRTFDSTMQLLNQFGSQGRGKNQFQAPQGMHLTNHGTIYIADSMNHRIVVLFDPNLWTAAGTAKLGTLPLNQNLILQSGYNLQVQQMSDTTSGTSVLSDGKLSITSGAILTTNSGSSIIADSLEIDATSILNLNVGSSFAVTQDIISNGK